MKFPVLNLEGEQTGRFVEVSDEVFAIQPNWHAIYLDTKRYLASQHRGTHKTKTRGEVQGSTRKIRPQKYTGQARLGQRTSPLLRGGGRVFGPRPRSYAIKVNKKVQLLARRSALSVQAQNGNILVIEDFELEQPRTKRIAEILRVVGASQRFTLFILPEPNRIIYLSARNIPYVETIPAYQLNTYLITRAYTLLFTERAILRVDQWLQPQKTTHHASV